MLVACIHLHSIIFILRPCALYHNVCLVVHRYWPFVYCSQPSFGSHNSSVTASYSSKRLSAHETAGNDHNRCGVCSIDKGDIKQDRSHYRNLDWTVKVLHCAHREPGRGVSTSARCPLQHNSNRMQSSAGGLCHEAGINKR